MTKWIPGIAVCVGSFFAWCYFVPQTADRVEQASNGCYHLTAGLGGMLHVALPDLGDLIYSERDAAKSTCAQMIYDGLTSGQAELTAHEDLVEKAKNPGRIFSRAASESTVNPGAAGSSDATSGLAAASSAVVPAMSTPARPVDPNLPNAGNPNTL